MKFFPWMVLMLVSPVMAQSTSATQQVGPGSTSSIEHGKKGPAGDKPHKMLDGALTPETRQTLQKAMTSGAAPEK